MTSVVLAEGREGRTWGPPHTHTHTQYLATFGHSKRPFVTRKPTLFETLKLHFELVMQYIISLFYFVNICVITLRVGGGGMGDKNTEKI